MNCLEVLRIVKKAFDELDIPFFLSCGLALGIYRDKNFVDRDLDIGILGDKYWRRYKEIEENLKKYGIKTITLIKSKNALSGLIPDEEGIGEHPLITIGIRGEGEKWALDICYYYRIDNYMWKWISNHREAFDCKLFDSFKSINFKGMNLYIPNPPEKYLEALYGKGWRKKEKKYNWRNRPTMIRAREIFRRYREETKKSHREIKK